MKRLHVHVAVESLEESVRFYSALFDADPTVIKSDYAKWMLDDPRVNFAISQRGAAPGLNHLGVQELQTQVIEENNTACCYAKSDKYWVNDPQDIPWETFHTLDGIPVFGGEESGEGACCIPSTNVDLQATAICCEPGQTVKSTAGGCC